MTETADVVIVGGGIEGAAAAWALAQRGVTDVLIVERDTVGSGMTGKSSGIVRCHHGVSSLAAMATVGLDVFENAEEIFGHDIDFCQTGYVVGVGEPNVDSLRKSLAAQRAVGVETEEIDATDVAAMWPYADLEPFAAFAHEARGGFGDAYRTAQALAVAARGAGASIRQGTAMTELPLDGDRATGVRLTDGTVVIATCIWTRDLLSPCGIDVPIRVVREQIVMIAPGVDLGPVPVFSDLVSLQYIRPEPGGEVLFGNSDLSHVQDAEPGDLAHRDRRSGRCRRIQWTRLQDRTRGRHARRRSGDRRTQRRRTHSRDRLRIVAIRRERPAEDAVSVSRRERDALGLLPWPPPTIEFRCSATSPAPPVTEIPASPSRVGVRGRHRTQRAPAPPAAGSHGRGDGRPSRHLQGDDEQDRERPDVMQPVDPGAASQGFRRAGHLAVPWRRRGAARGIRHGGHRSTDRPQRHQGGSRASRSL